MPLKSKAQARYLRCALWRKMDASPSLWREAQRLARQGEAPQAQMSFTREYERMRPLDEDRHNRAVVFTHRRERPFDTRGGSSTVSFPIRAAGTAVGFQETDCRKD